MLGGVSSAREGGVKERSSGGLPRGRRVKERCLADAGCGGMAEWRFGGDLPRGGSGDERSVAEGACGRMAGTLSQDELRGGGRAEWERFALY